MLTKLKRRLGIENNLQNELLLDLIADAQDHFKLITSIPYDVPEKYKFIIVDVASKLYNRKGSEGMSQESVDGYSAHYIASVFDEYLPYLEKEFNLCEDKREKGRVFFY